MYETAIPDETRQRLKELKPAKLVVGIPSYRNSRTVRYVVEQVASALDRHYAHLAPLIVHADGHSFDKTLSIASHVPLPKSVRRIATRYQGLPGKGSALRIIFEIATALQAQAVLLVEADVVSFVAEWVPKLLDPILNKELDLLLPIYDQIKPLMTTNDLLIYPLLSSMFNIPLRHPTAGEVAMAGGVAAFFTEQDVWETSVARAGVDVWMTAQVALGEGRLGQLHLPIKDHYSSPSFTLSEAKFLQEIGTLFRFGSLHERAWREGSMPPIGISTFGEPRSVPKTAKVPEALPIWQTGKDAVKDYIPERWEQIMTPHHFQTIEKLLQVPDKKLTFDAQLWARLVYDFLVVYNLGEGDPDKVVTALFPLFLMRQAALLKEAGQRRYSLRAYESLIRQQQQAFHNEFDYLLQRWEKYVTPEQYQLWQKLGLLSQHA